MKSCDDYRIILNQSTEERTALPVSAEAHFQSCSSVECQEIFAEYQLVNEAIAQWKSALPHVDLVAAVVKDLAPQVETHQPQVAPAPMAAPAGTRSVRGSSPAAAIAAVIATLSLCLMLMIGTMPESDERVAVTVVPPTQPITAPENVVIEEDMEAELRELGKTYGSWVQGAANKLTDTMTVVLITDQPASSEKASGWFSSLTEQIEPIESKLDETLKMLMEQVSAESDEQTYVSNTTLAVA